MNLLQHEHVVVYEEITGGVGINKRIRLGLKDGYIGLIKAVWFDVTGTSMFQGISLDPEKTGSINDAEISKSKDVIICLLQQAFQIYEFGEGIPVARDLLYMTDIVLTGSLRYGVHVLFERKKTTDLIEKSLLLRTR